MTAEDHPQVTDTVTLGDRVEVRVHRRPKIWRLRYRVLTPSYLGGALQQAEPRAPSFKGALRYWLRAADPKFREHEPRWLGGLGRDAGQSRVLLRVSGPGDWPTGRWDTSRVRTFDAKGDKGLPQNGLAYLGYPFKLDGGRGRRYDAEPQRERDYLEPGQELEVECLFPRAPDPELRRGLTAALWLLGQVGALGSRSRRGFGALSLAHWEGERDDWPERSALPLLAERTDAAGWLQGFGEGLGTLRGWLGEWPTEEIQRHPHLGTDARIALGETGVPARNWDQALADQGLAMQAFRQLYPPDYDALRAQADGIRPLTRTPRRAAFGLPLTFRIQRTVLEVVGYDPQDQRQLGRHGSLLHLRPVALGARLHPLWLRLAGAVPGEEPGAALNGRQPLNRADGNAMDEFLDQLGAHPLDSLPGFNP